MTAPATSRPAFELADAVDELLSSKGIEVRREDYNGNRWYLDPETNIEINSVTTVLGATSSKPYLVAWAARLAAEFCADHLGHLVETHKLAGRDATVGLIKGAAEAERNKARNRGTFVHDIVEALVLDTTLPDFTDQPDIAPYADAFVDWCIAWQPRFLAAEATVAHPGHGWAGTLDLIAYMPSLGKVYVIDVKTGKELDGDMSVQLATYWRAPEVWLPFGRKAPMPKTDGCAVLHLRGDRARFVDVTDQAGDDTYQEFLDRLALLQRYDGRPNRIGAVLQPLNPDGTLASPYLEDIGGVPLWDKLSQHGIYTLADLASQGVADLKAMGGVGPKRLDAYRVLLAEHHLTLKGEA